MGYSIPRQPPAVVLRSQFNWLRALLAVALSCVAGLTIAVGIVAGSGDERTASARGAPPAQLSQTGYPDGTRGPLPAQLPKTSYAEGTRGPLPAQLPKTSYAEGTRGPLPAQLPTPRYDGGPVSRYEGEAKYFTAPFKPVASATDGGSIYVNPSTGYASGAHRPQVSHPDDDGGAVWRYNAETKHVVPSGR
jgi:hypothetical protein